MSEDLVVKVCKTFIVLYFGRREIRVDVVLPSGGEWQLGGVRVVQSLFWISVRKTH